MLEEFKKFIAKGNVLDLAVAFIMGVAFNKIVTSLVNDIVMPIVGLATNGVSVTSRFLALDGKAYADIEEARKAGAAVLAYGSFIQVVIDFLIISFVLFMMVRQLHKFRFFAPPPAPPAP